MDATSSRDILAKNLRRFIEASGLTTRAWAIRKGLDVKLVERLSKNSHAVTLDNLEKVAAACGLQTWHLLLPEVDPSNPPGSPVLSDEDRAMLTKLRRLLE